MSEEEFEVPEIVNNLMTINDNESDFLPMLSLDQATSRYNQMKTLIASQMIDGVDYGTIPGTAKASLWKPGAEKLTTFFGLRVTFVDEEAIERWDGEPLFFYRRKCQLWRGNVLIAEASGSANSREDRYGWRWVTKDSVPGGDITDLKTKGGKTGMFEWQFENRQTEGQYGKPEEYYQMIDNKIANEEVERFDKEQHWDKKVAIYMEWDETLYRIPNDGIYSLVNTILKMADKRALVAATLIACNASDYFTQDMEDISEVIVTKSTKPSQKQAINVDPSVIIQSTLEAIDEKRFNGNDYLALGKALEFETAYVMEVKKEFETKEGKLTVTDFTGAALHLIEKYQTTNS